MITLTGLPFTERCIGGRKDFLFLTAAMGFFSYVDAFMETAVGKL